MAKKSRLYRTFYGGKGASGAYQTIINCLRPHDVYMELYLGDGTIFTHKKPAITNILNERDPVIYGDWITAGIDNIDLFCGDGLELLKSWVFDRAKQYCIYLDPPYPILSRREGKPRYRYEMSNEQHIELLEFVNKLALKRNVDIVISTYENEIYEKYLKNWHLVKFNSQTRQYTAIEYLYMNYDPSGGLLHEYTYLGRDATDRQRIKRKIEREVTRLQKLPAAERNAIITALKSLAS